MKGEHESRDRKFWKERLQSMVESQELATETRESANKAVEAIQAVAE